ncbi:MAG: hypothetical protein HZA28_03765 [Candidatus Omnitrophica bacterium]|nr:hypothetical protein [Candidatus Omnitrophota bacterium]
MERLKYALDNLRHGQLALVPLFDRKNARRIEISEAKRKQILRDQKENIIEIGGYRFVELEEFKKENEHLLIKKNSRLFLDLDTNELVEGISPQAGEIYLFDLSIGLFGPSISKLYDYKIYIWASAETRRERYLQRWRMGEKHPQFSLSQIMEKVDNIFGVRDKVVLSTSDTADLIINNNSSSFPSIGQEVAEEDDYPAPAQAPGGEGVSPLAVERATNGEGRGTDKASSPVTSEMARLRHRVFDLPEKQVKDTFAYLLENDNVFSGIDDGIRMSNEKVYEQYFTGAIDLANAANQLYELSRGNRSPQTEAADKESIKNHLVAKKTIFKFGSLDIGVRRAQEVKVRQFLDNPKDIALRQKVENAVRRDAARYALIQRFSGLPLQPPLRERVQQLTDKLKSRMAGITATDVMIYLAKSLNSDESAKRMDEASLRMLQKELTWTNLNNVDTDLFFWAISKPSLTKVIAEGIHLDEKDVSKILADSRFFNPYLSDAASPQASGGGSTSSPVEQVIYTPEEFWRLSGDGEFWNETFFIDLKPGKSLGLTRITMMVTDMYGLKIESATLNGRVSRHYQEVPFSDIAQIVKTQWHSLENFSQIVGDYIHRGDRIRVVSTSSDITGHFEEIKGKKLWFVTPKGVKISIAGDQIRMIRPASSPVGNSHQLSDISLQPMTDDRRLTTNPGGIDLNPALLDLQIKRDGNGVPLPLPQQPIETMHIDGFVPIIINITPIPNLPMLLGLADTAPDTDTKAVRPALKAREVEPVSLLN